MPARRPRSLSAWRGWGTGFRAVARTLRISPNTEVDPRFTTSRPFRVWTLVVRHPAVAVIDQ